MANQALYKKGSDIYAEFLNELHLIVDPSTMHAIFGTSPSITDVDELPPYTIGFDINAGSCLVRDSSSGAIYLYTNNKKYHITSQGAMNHYQFAGGIVCPVTGSDEPVADALLSHLTAGAKISH